MLCFAAMTCEVLCVRNTSTLSRTNFAAISAKRSPRPRRQISAEHPAYSGDDRGLFRPLQKPALARRIACARATAMHSCQPIPRCASTATKPPGYRVLATGRVPPRNRCTLRRKSPRRRHGSLADFGFAAACSNFGFIAGRGASPTLAQCKRDLLPIATLLHMRGIACGERTI
jgi:hypothetical protein